MPCGATQDGWVMVERSDRMWSTGEGNGKPLQYSCLETRRYNQSILKEISPLGVHWKDWCWSWNSNTLATLCEELTHWKRCWARLKAGEEGRPEDEMVGWHHWLNGYEFEKTPIDSEGQGSLVCCSPWGCKESDMTEWLNNNKNWWRVKCVLSHTEEEAVLLIRLTL